MQHYWLSKQMVHIVTARPWRVDVNEKGMRLPECEWRILKHQTYKSYLYCDLLMPKKNTILGYMFCPNSGFSSSQFTRSTVIIPLVLRHMFSAPMGGGVRLSISETLFWRKVLLSFFLSCRFRDKIIAHFCVALCSSPSQRSGRNSVQTHVL
jgi:hypothetical protein